jgi:hypothetical protein
MKQIFTLLFVCTLALSAQSQIWFDAGIKGAFGPTVMLDGNVFDHGHYKHAITTGHAIGGRLGVNFGYHAGTSLEYSAARSRQDFELDSDPHTRFTWKHSDILLLFRYSGNGAYVEIGPKYSIMNEVTHTRYNPEIDTDVSEFFEKNYLSGVLGFGSYLLGNDVLSLNLGIRIHYGLTDMVNEAGKENNYPIVIEPLQDRSKKTVAAAAQLQMEFNYAFGKFAKNACHSRWKLVLFQ